MGEESGEFVVEVSLLEILQDLLVLALHQTANLVLAR
jgi:hypothetical protein